jgi:hypothetical protein
MRSFLAACIAAIVIAVGAAVVLERYQEPAETAYASPSSTRL